MDTALATEPSPTKGSGRSGEELLDVVESVRAIDVSSDVEDELLALVANSVDTISTCSALCGLGLLHRQRGEFEAAVNCFDQSIRASPRSTISARSRIYWAGIRARLADFGGAKELLVAAAEIVADSDVALLELQTGMLADLQEIHHEALTRYGRAIELTQSERDGYVRSLALNNRGLVRRKLGYLDDAEYDFRSVLIAPESDQRVLGLAQHNLGALLGQRGSVREAIDRVDRAGLAHRGFGIDGGQAAIAEAEILLHAALYAECLASGQQALSDETVRQDTASLEVPDLLVLVARASLGMGRLDPAGEHLDRARALFAQQERPISEAQCAMVLAVLERAELPDIGPDDPGADAVYEALIAVANNVADIDPERANECWNAASQATGSDRKQLQVLGHYAQARIHLAHGDAVAAKTEAMVLIDLLAEHTADINAVELRAALVFGLVDVEGLAVRIARAGEPLDLACLIDQANTVVHSIAPLSVADAEFVTQLDALRSSINQRDPARIDRAELDSLEARLRSLHRRMERSDAPTSAPLGIEQLRNATASQTIVMFAELDDHLWRLVLPSAADLGEGSTLVDLGSRETLNSSIRRVRFVSDGLARRPMPIPKQLIEGLDRTAVALDDLLLGGVDIEPGTDVVLFPGRFLTSVPWRVLPSARRWRVGINAGTPFVCSGAQGHVGLLAKAKRVLVVAGPGLGAGIEAEVAAVAAMYDDPVVLTGASASVSAVLHALENVDIAHVAGHGSLHAHDPLMAMITLADGPLTVYDIEMATSTPPMVVLASCLVGSGGSTGSEVSYGFASAMASRGTRQLIISPIELDDDKTAIVMPELHRALAAGASARVALDSLHFDQLDLERVADSLLAVESETFA